MKRLLALTLVTTIGAAGCLQRGQEDGVREALPQADQLQIKLPGAVVSGTASTASGISSASAPLLGETAVFYNLTRGVSRELNGGAYFILSLVKLISEYPVTSIQGDTYIWGPWSDALNPAEYRLTARQDGMGAYLWSLEGRQKADAGAAFAAVVSGVAMPGRLPNRGTGRFHMDFDYSHKLDPLNKGEGQLDVVYDLESEPASIQMDFAKNATMPGGTTGVATAHYAYSLAADGSGDFQFGVHGDIDKSGTTAWEDSLIRSRWLATGAGRADVKVTSGDLGTRTLIGSECWSVSFVRTFWTDNLGFSPTEGASSTCAFADTNLPGSF